MIASQPLIAAVVAILLVASASPAQGRKYERCQLARELKNKYGFPTGQIATWVCIAYHESKYETTAVSPPNKDGSRDYGLFQVNNRYWCDRGSRGCAVSCSTLLKDMSRNTKCVKAVYAETKRLRGDGFLAWTTYKYCRNPASFVKGCGI